MSLEAAAGLLQCLIEEGVVGFAGMVLEIEEALERGAVFLGRASGEVVKRGAGGVRQVVVPAVGAKDLDRAVGVEAHFVALHDGSPPRGDPSVTMTDEKRHSGYIQFRVFWNICHHDLFCR